MVRFLPILFGALTALGSAAQSPRAEVELDAASLEFFEKRVRPLLVKHCYECHSAESKKVKGGLRIDSRAGWAAGGDSGPALVPGEPDDSLLVRAVRYDDPDLQMPPKGKLSDAEIAVLVDWVRRGAPDPRTDAGTPSSASAGRGGMDLEAGRRFWAFVPPRKLPPPEVKDTAWPRGDIDRFVLARLEQHGIPPTRDADRQTLVRRIYFDLTGLPPSLADIEQFLGDDSPDAVAALVNRLLESPRYGERWGRHWLDVARYADSSGGGRSLLFPNAWRYRDYVIDSIQRNKPFDQFIREQIAGDLYAHHSATAGHGGNGERPAEPLVATAFLMIGAHNYELQDKEQLRMDVVDEQIESVGRAFLGMTLGCARCHDHKFDPIPTADYYALAGIFRSTKSLTPGNVSGFEQHELPVSAERRAELDAYAAATKQVQTKLDAAKSQLKSLDGDKVAGAGGPGRDALLGTVVDDAEAKLVGNWTKSKFNAGFVGEGYIHDGAGGKGERSVVFPVDLPQDGEYEVRVSYTHGSNRSPSVPVTVRHQEDEDTIQIDQRERPPIDGRFVSLGRWRFQKGLRDAVTITNEATTGHVIVDAVQFIPVELLEKPAAAVAAAPAESARADGSSEAAERDRAEQRKELESGIKVIEAELKKLKDSAPEPAPQAMGVKDEKQTGDFQICIRGDVHNLGAAVPRGFLAVASSATQPPAIATAESGRRELAEWLSSPDNPLTARVTVNRIWHHLFGSGLVRTTDNFGITGETPSHPELLDWLAIRFIEHGYSIKRTIREIMLSRTYQLASERVGPTVASGGAPDPENRLLARQNRKRMDAESIRDSILAVSGQLDLSRGGPSIRDKTTSEYGYTFDSQRRSVYLPVFRNNLPDIFEVFDFADPNNVTGRRNVSTLPAQALYLMNSPFVMQQARRAAEAILETDMQDGARVELAYRRAIGRAPRPAERELALRYLREFKPAKAADPTAERLDAWTRLFQSLFASLDFRYVH